MPNGLQVGQALIIVRDIVNALVSAGLLSTVGDFNFANVANDVLAVQAVETVLKNHGVTVPAKVDEILAALPLLLKIFGL